MNATTKFLLAGAAALMTASCSQPPWGTQSATQPSAPGAGQPVQLAAQPPGIPPNARPGECYARVQVPATYRTQNRTVVVQAASERIEVTPPEYGWEERRVEVTPARRTLRVIPATYRWT